MKHQGQAKAHSAEAENHKGKSWHCLTGCSHGHPAGSSRFQVHGSPLWKQTSSLDGRLKTENDRAF
jgi:hypothetical protein